MENRRKDNMVPTVLYLDLCLLYLFLIKIDQCFLNGRYTRFFLTTLIFGANIKVAYQIYVFMVKSCLGVS